MIAQPRRRRRRLITVIWREITDDIEVVNGMYEKVLSKQQLILLDFKNELNFINKNKSRKSFSAYHGRKCRFMNEFHAIYEWGL